MSTASDRFIELESKIFRTIEVVRTARQELSASRAQVKALEREVEQLSRERDLIKNKVESLLETLSELTEESIV